MHMSTDVRCAPLYTVSKLLVLGAGLMWQSIFPRLSYRDTAARVCYIQNSSIFYTFPIAQPAPLFAHVRTWRNSSGQPVSFLVTLYEFERLGFLIDFSVASNPILDLARSLPFLSRSFIRYESFLKIAWLSWLVRFGSGSFFVREHSWQ